MPSYAKPDVADTVAGAFATQFGATDGTGGLLEADQDKALPDIPGLTGKATQGARYTWVFPNMTFTANSDALWCYEAYPLGPARCRVVQTSCFPPETIALPEFAEKSEAYLGRMDAALAEDVEALVNQQSGMSCPDAQPGRFQPDLETERGGLCPLVQSTLGVSLFSGTASRKEHVVEYRRRDQGQDRGEGKAAHDGHRHGLEERIPDQRDHPRVSSLPLPI